jgi:steroid delta-isomerase-like uncharacterized protein
MPEQDVIKIARENVDAFNVGDWQRFRAALAADAVYQEPATQRRLQGQGRVVEASQTWRQAFPDAKGTITNALASGDTAVLEITWEGTQTGPLVGSGSTIPPSGKRVTVQAVQVITVQGNQIKETRHYFDMLGMLQQIGATPR